MSIDLLDVPYDPELAPGARNAVFTCLAVQPGERVALLAGSGRLEIAAALAAQVAEAGGVLDAMLLEDFGPRPAVALPREAAAAFEGADVSIFAADAAPGELAMRRAMTAVVDRRRIRHAHMVGVTPEIMRQGMRADYARVDALTRWVRDRALESRVITCTTPAGTELRAVFDRSVPWIPTSGLISRDKWGNLPGGETFTSPARVDGVFVVDGVLGDWLAPKYGDLRATPMTIEIEDSRIVSVSCDDDRALADFREYVRTDENSDRVGEYALGTNLAVKELIGNMLQDEKIPGVHIAFGHPYSEHTGVPWRSTSHIDVVGREFDVWFDGVPVMRRGEYLTGGAV